MKALTLPQLFTALVLTLVAASVAIALTGCTLTFEADGTRALTVDGESLIQILADK